MLSKEELLTKDISELENIAQSLGVTNEFDDDKEGLIYAILDRQADRGAAEQAAPRPLSARVKSISYQRMETEEYARETLTWY